MAELLIMLKDNLNPDPAARYYKGDIVEVQEDDFKWGTEMSYFGVLKIPGLSVGKVLKYASPELELDESSMTFTKMKKRRMWNLLINNIPTAVKQEFVTNHEYTTTVAQIKNFIQNKITGLKDGDLNG